MDFLGEGLRRAVALLLAGDGEVYGIALLTLKIGLIATVLACGLGIPVGFVLATRPFWGRRAALTVINTALAFPTVVVGLLRSEEHTSELQSLAYLVCRLLLEKKKTKQ